MVKSKIQLYRNDADRNEVLTYNGIVLDEYCTYCTIDESLYDDTFSAELDLRLPKLQKQTGIESEVVEVVKEYAITQSHFSKPILKTQPDTDDGQIILEDGIRLEKLSEVGNYAKVLYNGKEYYIDKNSIGNFTQETERVEIGENIFGYTNAEYTVLNFQPNTRVQILDESNAQDYKVKKDNTEYTLPKKITITEQVGTKTYVKILVDTKGYSIKDTSSAPLYTIAANTEVEFVDEDSNWARIKHNNQIAFVEKVRIDRISLGTFGIITANGGLKLRATYPSGDVLVVIPQGAKIKIDGEENGWIKTTYSGHTGWCSATYVGSVAEEFEERQVPQLGDRRTQNIYEDKIIDSLQSKREIEKIYQTIEHEYCETVTKEWVTVVFKEPSFTSTPIAILNSGTKVRILGKEKDYYRIEYGITTGYIMSDKLTNFTTEITYETIIKEESKEVNIREILKLGSILKIADEYGDEIFRITNINGDDTVQTVYARQITLEDSLSLWIEDSRPTLINGAAALEKLYTDSTGKVKEIFTYSDIAETNTTYIIDKTFYDALHDSENGFLTRWGGEIERRGYKLSILKQRGNDNGVVFRRGKNYSGVSEDVQLDDLVTRIIPVGFDGIQIEEKYVDSPKVNDYYNIFPREIKFEDVKYKNSPNNSDGEGFDTLEEAQEELRKRAREYFLVNRCDEIKATYDVEVVDISKTEEYKDYSIFETTRIGDIVQIIDEKIGINFSSRVVSRKYDVLSEKRITTKVSNVIKSVASLTLEDLAEKIENIQFPEISVPEIPGIQEIVEEVTGIIEDIIKQGSFGGHVVLKENEILIMDTKDVNTAKQGIVINKNGLAGFTNGYFGSYNTAITIDGQIVADAITVGKLNANLIKVGTLMSANGKSWLNMENGTFNWGDKLIFDGNSLTINLSTGKTLENEIGDMKNNIEEAIETSTVAKVTAQGFETKLTQTKGELEKKITDIKATVDGFEVQVNKMSGNNLVANSNFQSEKTFKARNLGIGVDSWLIRQVYDDVKAPNIGGKWLFMHTSRQWCDVETNLYFDCKPNTTYVISMDMIARSVAHIRQSMIFLVRESGGEIKIFENVTFDGNWKRERYVFKSGSIEGRLYFKLGIEAPDQFSWAGFTNIKVCEGEGIGDDVWTPSPNEIYQSNTVINEYGVTVYGHDNTSATFGYNGSKWRDNNGNEGISIDNGGMEFIDMDNGEFMGFLRSSFKNPNPNYNGITFSTAKLGDYIALGVSLDAVRGGTLNSGEALSVYSSHVLQKHHAGVHLWDYDNFENVVAKVYNHTHYVQSGGSMYVPTTIYLDELDQKYPNWIGSTTDDALAIFGNDEVRIGIRNGAQNINVIKVKETTGNHQVHFYGDVDLHNYTLRNYRSTYSLLNTNTSRSAKATSLISDNEKETVRYIYKKKELQEGKLILNIPNKYKGNNYTIVGLVKHGKGDVWVEDEKENVFIIAGENDIRVTIEIEIELNEEIQPMNINVLDSENTSENVEKKPEKAE